MIGADVVVDPAINSPHQTWKETAVWHGSDAPALPPWLPGPHLRPCVIFECVGVPGILDQIVALAPANARIVVVGICMGRDSIEPVIAINKELNIQFVTCYTADEFGATLRNIADGRRARRGPDYGEDVPRVLIRSIRSTKVSRSTREDHG